MIHLIVTQPTLRVRRIQLPTKVDVALLYNVSKGNIRLSSIPGSLSLTSTVPMFLATKHAIVRTWLSTFCL